MTTSRHQAADPGPCRVVLLDDRPFVGAALAVALHGRDVQVVERCERTAALSCMLIAHQPDALVLSNGLTRLTRQLLPGCKAAVAGMGTVLVAEAEDDVATLYAAGAVDAVLGPEAGVEQLRRAIQRVRTGERFVAELGRRRVLPAEPPVQLTERERQVLQLLATGAANEAIAATLGVTVNTVRAHVQAVLGKLGEGRRLRAVRRAEELGLLEPLIA